MKTSFAKKDETPTSPTEVQEEGSGQEIVPAQTKAVGQPLPQNSDMQGEWLRKDVRLPRINLVQKVSDAELLRNFGIGAFVLAKEVKLAQETENPLKATALQIAKDYVQKVEFDSGDQPAIFATEQEVLDSGGSLYYADFESGNYFQPRAHIEFALAAPEGASENDLALFPFDFNGTAYALALYTVASSAYTSLAKELATMRNVNKVLRQGLRFGSLSITAETRKKNTKSWHVPVARFAGANSPELIAFFEQIEPSLASK